MGEIGGVGRLESMVTGPSGRSRSEVRPLSAERCPPLADLTPISARRTPSTVTTESRQDFFSGTREVRERHRFDVGRLESYMREHVRGFSGALSIREFKGGQSNPTY